MARKDKKITVLENIELKPQVIGTAYRKKNNFGRVAIIFVVFLLVIYFIDDISLFVNNILGIETAVTIKENADEKKRKSDSKDERDEVVYNTISNELEIKIDSLVLNNFNYSNNSITFDVSNYGNVSVDLSNKKYFLETYSSEKTLIDRFKIDITSVNAGAKIPYKVDTTNTFSYIVFNEKSIEDYPSVTLNKDEYGMGIITCVKGIDNIVYTFNNDELISIKETITDNGISDSEYESRLSTYRTKTSAYNGISGINATFNSTENGYSAIITVDLQKVNMASISEKYYFSYKELPKVVKFEMQTYGYNCN